MKPGCTLFLLLCSALAVTTAAHTQTLDTAATASYLLVGAPTFDLSISQFRESFNSQSPSLPLNEFRAIDSGPDKANLTHTAGKISESLYASIVLERGTLKAKNIQITRLSIQEPEQKIVKAKAQAYMTAVARTLTPLMTKTQSQEKPQSLPTTRKNKRHYTEAEDALRYVVAGGGEEGLTFAVESIKLVLSESLEGLNE